MRIFGSDRIQGLMGKLGMEEGEAIEHRMVSRAIERAQKQVEGRNFETRKHLLEYDDVMNKQREAIYKLRRDILEGREGREYVLDIAGDILDALLETHCPEKADPMDWNLPGLRTEMLAYFNINAGELKLDELGIDELRDTLWNAIETRYTEKEARHDPEVMRSFERAIMLHAVDVAWKDHLLALDHLKEGIGLRGYGQRDPLKEYKRESFELFEMMPSGSRTTSSRSSSATSRSPRSRWSSSAPASSGRRPRSSSPPRPRSRVSSRSRPCNRDVKVGRNDPCPCGSGKKYKKCHGAAVTVG